MTRPTISLAEAVSRIAYRRELTSAQLRERRNLHAARQPVPSGEARLAYLDQRWRSTLPPHQAAEGGLDPCPEPPRPRGALPRYIEARLEAAGRKVLALIYGGVEAWGDAWHEKGGIDATDAPIPRSFVGGPVWADPFGEQITSDWMTEQRFGVPLEGYKNVRLDRAQFLEAIGETRRPGNAAAARRSGEPRQAGTGGRPAKWPERRPAIQAKARELAPTVRGKGAELLPLVHAVAPWAKTEFGEEPGETTLKDMLRPLVHEIKAGVEKVKKVEN